MLRRKCLAVSLVLAALAAEARAGDHLVAAPQVSARLSEAAASRERSLEELGGVLGSEPGARACRLLGTNVAEVRRHLETLSDAELEDLARRAAELRADPVAGYLGALEQILVIVLLVVLIIFVAQRID